MAALPAAAQNLQQFEGKWQATSVESAPAFDLDPAKFQLEIRQVRDGGFAARWTNPPLPESENADAQIDGRLVPTGQPGVFGPEVRDPSLLGRWFSSPASGNPLDLQTLVWARLSDQDLVFYSLKIDQQGQPALTRTVYARDGDGLAFEREVRFGADDPVVIVGQLVRTGS